MDDSWGKRYAARIATWRMPTSAAEKDELVLAYGRDGCTLLKAVSAAAPDDSDLAFLPQIRSHRHPTRRVMPQASLAHHPLVTHRHHVPPTRAAPENALLHGIEPPVSFHRRGRRLCLHASATVAPLAALRGPRRDRLGLPVTSRSESAVHSAMKYNSRLRRASRWLALVSVPGAA